ncbi:MAG: orotidine-5'-phosphate decarboxylase [Planctomycetota bacterium]|nr:orotidine-5'-phosphate decarboxylase [Planctomycetota bacterium]
MTFADRLDYAVARVGHPCIVGLDPHFDLLPDEFAAARQPNVPRAERATALAAFCRELIDVCAGRVAAVKPQSAFFEVLGGFGVAAWEEVVHASHAAGLLVIGDVKRGDIASTSAAYASAYLEGVPGRDPSTLCDAITVNPFLGDDSIEPFVDACERTEKGIFVLVRTSNRGADRFQHHGSPELCYEVADAVDRWGARLASDSGLSSVGAVVGATHTDELAALRARMPHATLLLPGYGHQGATAADVVPAFVPGPEGPRGALVSSSRAIAFAYRSSGGSGTKHWKDAAREALNAMIAEVSSALQAHD